MLGPEPLPGDYVQIWELQPSARQEGPNWVGPRIPADALLFSVLTVKALQGLGFLGKPDISLHLGKPGSG